MAINRQTNSLLLKSNRVMETRLAESGLVELSALEEANRLFLARVREGDLLKASVLRILLIETQRLQERKLLNYQLENCGVGGMLLDHYSLREDLIGMYDLDDCTATWTIPIDHLGDCTLLATAYYLSDFVKQHWQDKIEGRLIWYVVPFHQIEGLLDTLRGKRSTITTAGQKE